MFQLKLIGENFETMHTQWIKYRYILKKHEIDKYLIEQHKNTPNHCGSLESNDKSHFPH